MDLPKIAPAEIKTLLNSHSGDSIPLDSQWPAAVLVPIIPKEEGFSLLFHVRTSEVEHHKGEVSFPGGARDEDDESLEITALRETYEEVGVQQSDIEILGQLGDHKTPSGFHITPFVGFIPSSYKYDPSAIEVKQLIEVPLDYLWNIYIEGPKEFKFRPDRPAVLAYEYIYEGNRIWGATARILSEFFKVLEDNNSN